MTMTKTVGAHVGSPVPRQALILLGRADALLSEAVGERESADRFLGSYAAALKGAAAVLASVPGAIGPRPRSRSAWVLMAKAVPEMTPWADYFASFSSTRVAVEAGAARSVDDATADEFYRRVGRFLHAVDDRFGDQSRFALADAVDTPLSA